MKKKLILVPLLTVMLIVALIVATGCAGDTGLKGTRGLEGIQGEQGDQGEIGSQGEAGIQGVIGRIGLKGATGSTGAAGATGDQGIQGEQGKRGSGGAGARGATGATGATGPAGEQGDEGDAGADADPGVLQALQDQIDVLMARIVALVSPQMEKISPLVVSTSTPEVLTGTVELVFDFYDAEDDLVELEIDFGPDPYGDWTNIGGPDNREQMKFQAIAGQEEDPLVLALMASVGMFVNYNDVEQRWTLTIDTTATQTQQIIDLGFAPWATVVGAPIWPAGLFHWYLEVVDAKGNLWGDMMAPPAYSHYINTF